MRSIGEVIEEQVLRVKENGVIVAEVPNRAWPTKPRSTSVRSMSRRIGASCSRSRRPN
jgi:hypothetical protein